MRIRTGRHNPHTLYVQLGPEPSDQDPFIGSTIWPHYAATIAAMSERAEPVAPTYVPAKAITPRYRTAGSWPTACERCGALVDADLQQRHTAWHSRVDQTPA